MRVTDLIEKLKTLGFTKEEKFKIEQTNELIEAISQLRRNIND